MKKLLPHYLKKGRKGECGLFGTNPWPQKEYGEGKSSKTKGGVT